MSDFVTEAPTKRWVYKVVYIDSNDVEQTVEGNLPFRNQDLVLKYLARRFRKEAKHGLFKEMSVQEITRGQDGVENTVIAAQTSAAFRNMARPPIMSSMGPALPPPVPQPEKPKLEKQNCFVYRYMGPLITESSKKHKFYEVVPHTT